MKPKLYSVAAAGVALLLASCSWSDHTPAPSAVAVPEAAPKPDITRTEAQVRKVEAKVDDVEDAVRDVGSRLDAARVAADSIEVAAEQAYANGLEAGSAAADELREFVIELKVELRESTKARELAMQSLVETKVELVETERVNSKLRSEIEVIAAANKNLEGKLKEANVKIGTIQDIAKERDSAVVAVATTQAELDEALKYKWGVWIGIGVIVVYFIIRIFIATGKWAPQRRIARFFF